MGKKAVIFSLCALLCTSVGWAATIELPAAAPPDNVALGTGYGEVSPSGDISLMFNAVASYVVYIGDAVGTEITGTDATLDILTKDGAEPEWAVLPPFSTSQDWVDGFPAENFAEVSTGDFITREPLYDTGVNVDLSKLGSQVGLWLSVQTAGNEPVLEPLAGIPEPSTLALLLLGGLGLLVFQLRRS